MAFLSLQGMFSGRDIRKLQGTPFHLAQVTSSVAQALIIIILIFFFSCWFMHLFVD